MYSGTIQTNNSLGQDLAYDLRQTYHKIVTNNLDYIDVMKRMRNYAEWFKGLKDLHCVVKHKFKSPEKDEKQYQKLISAAIQTFNTYKLVYLGQSKDPEGVSKVDDCLYEIEMLLWTATDDANLYGSNRKVQGL